MRSTDCIADDLASAWFLRWRDEIDHDGLEVRRLWALAAAAEALEARGCLTDGRQGLGVGLEADLLEPSLTARGCQVATAPSMDDRPASLGEPDFVWLMQNGRRPGALTDDAIAVLDAGHALAEGGWLVVTLELDISSIDLAAPSADAVLWRIEDVRLLCEQMRTEALRADPLLLRLGTSAIDRTISYEPGTVTDANPAIKVPSGSHVATPVVLCFQKVREPTGTHAEAEADERQWAFNYATLQSHLLINDALRDYHAPYEPDAYITAELVPEQPTLEAVVRPGERVAVDLRFVNRSPLTLFDADGTRPYNAAPLVAVTAAPLNRASSLVTEGWASQNRPSISFAVPFVRGEPGWNPHRIRPGERFDFSFEVVAPDSPGVHEEHFALAFEGVGHVPGTDIELRLTVREDAPELPTSRRPQVAGPTPLELLEDAQLAALLDEEGHPGEAIVAGFTSWLVLLGGREYHARRSLVPVEFTAFLRDWIRVHHPTVAMPEQAEEHIVTQGRPIALHAPSITPGDGARLVVVASTPRVGGTAISQAIADAGDWPRYACRISVVDPNKLRMPTVVHVHDPRAGFLADVGDQVPHTVVSITRHPLDALVSMWKFHQHNPNREHWAWAGPDLFKHVPTDVDLDSDEFVQWATAPKAESLLRVSASWLDHADVVVRYEDYKQEPVSTIARVMQVVDQSVPLGRIERVVGRIEREFLVGSRNQHRWRGESGYASLMAPERAQAILDHHAEVIAFLGY